MKLWNLTHTITAEMPVYPGTPSPRRAAAAHVLPETSTLDALKVENCAGAAVVDGAGLPDHLAPL